MREYLDLSWLGQTEQKVRQQAGQITDVKKTPLARARAIYEWIIDNMQRDPDAKACGLCNVERLLSTRMGKCADLHTVFVSLLRTGSRYLGHPHAEGKRRRSITKKQHCWAEFYLPGRGWVPVDAAGVRRIVFDRKLTAADAK